MSTSGGTTGPALPVTVPNGGTGDTTLTAHGVLVGEGASAVAITAAGTAGQVLTSNGAAADPTFQAGGGAVPFPTFAGAGRPEGTRIGSVGDSYLDTTNGALFLKVNGTATNVGWFGFGADAFDDSAGVLTIGAAPEFIAAVLVAGAHASAQLSDTLGLNGTGNALSWVANGTDGQQLVRLTLGSSGQFVTTFTAAGITQLPGPIATAPASSHTAIGAFGQVAIGTPLQNTTGYDLLVTGSVSVTAATNGIVNLGVGSTATPTVDPITPAFTTAALEVIGFSAVVPNNYYLSLTTSGTITIGTPVSTATPL